MFKTLFLLLLAVPVFSQNFKSPNYVSLAQQKVYDVEIIVFAYNTHLPNHNTYSNKAIFDDGEAFVLRRKPKNALLIKASNVEQQSEFTIAIDNNKNNKHALVWFEHSSKNFQLRDIWKKLLKQENTEPLIHRAWRQPATAFNNPQYIKLTNSYPQKITDNDPNNFANQENTKQNNTELVYPDNAIVGKVALSKGRYLHFGHNLNLIKQYQIDYVTKNMVFILTERKQLHTGELHYYDSPWFGSIVKITNVTGEENENNPNNSTHRP